MATTTHRELPRLGPRPSRVSKPTLVLAGAVVLAEGLLAGALVLPRLAPLLLLAAGALVGTAILRRPTLGVVGGAVLTVSILPAALVAVPLGPLEVRGHELLIAGLFATAIVAPRDHRWGGAPAGLLAAFLGMLALSSLLALSAGRTSAGEAWAWARLLAPLALVLALPRLLPDRRSMVGMLDAGVVIAALTGVVALVFLLAPAAAEVIPGSTDLVDSGAVYGAGVERVRLPGLALAYLLFWYAVVRLVGAPPGRRALWIAGLAAMVANLAISLNRNMWLGLVVGLGVLLMMAGAGLRGRVVAGLVVTVVAAAVLLVGLAEEPAVRGPLQGVVERGDTLLDPASLLREDSLRDRANETDRAWRAAARSPLWGIGPGVQFGVFFNAPNPDGSYVRTPQYFLHNQYLYLLLITGVPGLALFVGFLVTTGRLAWSNRGDPLVAALGAAVVMTAVSAVVMIAFASPAYAYVLALVTGAIVVLARGRAAGDQVVTSP